MTAVATHARERRSADERREEIIVAALIEFADLGYQGTSTEAIARRVGISQPYLFRLFRTKRELFIATVDRCFEETKLMFETASTGKSGRDALEAMGTAYVESINTNPIKLRVQLHAYAACSDPVVRTVVARGFGALVQFVEQAADVPTKDVASFFAQGMLLNVMATAGALGADQPWAQRLMEGCLTMCE